MRVLIVKLSSLGDILHTLPALSDAAKAIENISFDWVVEPGFQEIPQWHPSVKNVIPFGLRKWLKSPIKAILSGELKTAYQAIKTQNYDLIIDAQGLLKSAIVTKIARSKIKVGYAKLGIKEPVATYFYDKKIAVPFGQPADQRIRQLFSGALGYPLPLTPPEYSIKILQETKIKINNKKSLLFFHSTTWDTKHWFEVQWIALATLASEAGYQVLLPWGNSLEKERAERIRQACMHLKIVPSVLGQRLNLNEMAVLISSSTAVVTLDTGLGHIAAAMGGITVSLYGPTSPKLTGCYGANHIALTPSSSLACAPCLAKNCKIKTQACLSDLSPHFVWQTLHQKIKSQKE